MSLLIKRGDTDLHRAWYNVHAHSMLTMICRILQTSLHCCPTISSWSCDDTNLPLSNHPSCQTAELFFLSHLHGYLKVHRLSLLKRQGHIYKHSQDRIPFTSKRPESDSTQRTLRRAGYETQAWCFLARVKLGSWSCCLFFYTFWMSNSQKALWGDGASPSPTGRTASRLTHTHSCRFSAHQ